MLTESLVKSKENKTDVQELLTLVAAIVARLLEGSDGQQTTRTEHKPSSP
jgi:hypothetical protein